ncbi:hypothetical protein ACQPW1_27165 [Nocardia sp. CA-128927]|uniref:hypothetical protein n=1 Tax=Nocardia sp. CA-128927 TaxID=3239975 RepID=UPI003D984492
MFEPREFKKAKRDVEEAVRSVIQSSHLGTSNDVAARMVLEVQAERFRSLGGDVGKAVHGQGWYARAIMGSTACTREFMEHLATTAARVH